MNLWKTIISSETEAAHYVRLSGSIFICETDCQCNELAYASYVQPGVLMRRAGATLDDCDRRLLSAYIAPEGRYHSVPIFLFRLTSLG